MANTAGIEIFISNQKLSVTVQWNFYKLQLDVRRIWLGCFRQRGEGGGVVKWELDRNITMAHPKFRLPNRIRCWPKIEIDGANINLMGLSVCPSDSSIRWSHRPKQAAGVTNKKGTRTGMGEWERNGTGKGYGDCGGVRSSCGREMFNFRGKTKGAAVLFFSK